MNKRYVSIWLKYLLTDHVQRKEPALAKVPFVLSCPSHGRLIVAASNPEAARKGILSGMVLADARAIEPTTEVRNHDAELEQKLLLKMAEWCIRFAPIAAVDLPGGVILDASGCAHLWGGEEKYIEDIISKFALRGYQAKAAIADTIGAAWAMARFGTALVIPPGQQTQALLPLPSSGLRLNQEVLDKLTKLGLRQIKDVLGMSKASLRRRFGEEIISRINQAIGIEEEHPVAVLPSETYSERLPCIDLIVTATGIKLALERTLDKLCDKLSSKEMGLRIARLLCYRIDGKIEEVKISTNRPSNNFHHLLKLFEPELSHIEPDLGIELFILEAPLVEACSPSQTHIWESKWAVDSIPFSEFIDRVQSRIGSHKITRWMPDEHYWPERACKKAITYNQTLQNNWKVERPRPLFLLPHPETIEVAAPVPDYPPMLFRRKGKVHKIIKADGPERIEQEWWIEEGHHRDYYGVEDDEGHRYWIFRSGHYDAANKSQWFLHGFFS